MHRHRYGIALAVAALVLVATTGQVAAGGSGAHDFHKAFEFARSHHEGGWIGIKIDRSHDDRDGVVISEILDDSPASRIDLRAGDVVIGLDGRSIDSSRELIDRVGEFSPGTSVELEILRDGDRRTVQIELGERPDRGAYSFEWEGEMPEGFDMEQLHEQMGDLHEQLGEMNFEFHTPDAPEAPHAPMRFHFDNFRFGPGHQRPRLGVELTELTDELREHLGGSRGVGILVGRLIPDMPAEAAGIEVGDVIESVDGETIDDAGDLVRALDERAGETIRIGLVRDRRTMTIDVRLPTPVAPRTVGPRA